jgi:hypothetical protein
MAKRKNDFFRSAGLKLNREIKDERKRIEQEAPHKKGFIKQLDAQTESKAVREAKAFKTYEGTAIDKPRPAIQQDFTVDPDKVEPNEPNKGFANEVNFNLWKNNVK